MIDKTNYLSIIGPEYGTTEAAWKGILTEAERVSDLHMNMKDQLCNDVMQQIRVWQKDNYHKVSQPLRHSINTLHLAVCCSTSVGDDAD